MDLNVSNEEQIKALRFCSQHLDGSWKKISLVDLIVEKLSGGMSNLLYRCALSDQIQLEANEPRQVLLRIYGPSYSNAQVQLQIFNQLADTNLGPALYGYFDEGRLEEYLPSSPLTWTAMTSDAISAVVAKKIASIHKLNVGTLDKHSHWLLDMFNQLNEFLVIAKRSPPSFENDVLESTRAIAMGLISIDFQPEIDYLMEILEEIKSPLVFSHNDLHQNNILLMQQLDNDHQRMEDRVVLIDFEYCSYNYRTFDAANHLSEWCFDYTLDKYPYFSASADRFPSDATQKTFLGHYFRELASDGTKESTQRNGLGTSDKIDSLWKEMQPCLLASNFLWALWAIKSAYKSKIKFGYWEMAKQKWDIYQLCKDRFVKRQAATIGCEGDLVQTPKM